MTLFPITAKGSAKIQNLFYQARYEVVGNRVGDWCWGASLLLITRKSHQFRGHLSGHCRRIIRFILHFQVYSPFSGRFHPKQIQLAASWWWRFLGALQTHGWWLAPTKFIRFGKPRGLSSTEPASISHPTQKSEVFWGKKTCYGWDNASSGSLALSLYNAPWNCSE